MSVIVWDEVGERIFETGVDRGVLYPSTGEGVPWNGLVSVRENTLGGDSDPLYYDGTKFLDWIENEDFAATIEAYSAPDEFALCDGAKALAAGLYATQQPRITFGLSYRTLVGNDIVGTDFAYKLHLVYGATASPATRTVKTLSNKVAPSTVSWDINCVPPASATYKPTAHFIIDSRLADPGALAALEALLYGTDEDLPELPTQAVVISTLSV